MITVIVPTDFSAIANNAARYAAQMLTGHYDAQLVLLHVYEKASEEENVKNLLQKLKEELTYKNPVKIETVCEEHSDFVDTLERHVRHRGAQLVVMGITGKNPIAKVLFGSNTLKMVERNVCPVLIVPPSAQFTQVKNVALTSDFKDVHTSTPVVPIKNVLKLFFPSLHVVNVNSEIYVSLTEEYLAQRNQIMTMFEEFKPEFYFITTYDVHDTINQFVVDKNIDMLITVPRSRSVFTGMFKSSTTEKLAYETAIPILAAHE